MIQQRIIHIEEKDDAECGIGNSSRSVTPCAVKSKSSFDRLHMRWRNGYCASAPNHADSVAHSKALADMLRLLHLVDHRHRIVLDRDAAFPLTIREQLIRSQAEFPGSLTWKKIG